MGISGRAVRALLLLIGFYAIGFGLLGALLAVNVVTAELDVPGALFGKVLVATLIAAVPILRGIFFTRGNRMRKAPGVALQPEQQPLLWQRVGELARQSGTRPPKEIRLTAEVNAAVHENSRMLGLLPGKRRLFIGVPLLIGLSPSQFDAVLAHELGHYSNQDTRLAGLVHRGRASMTNTIRLYARTSGDGVLFSIYKGYGELFLRNTHAISRSQELAADLSAARIAGRDNTASALRQIPALDAGFDFYLSRYATAGAAIGLLPTASEFLGGFGRLLADPKRNAELDRLRQDLPEPEATPYDSHPPMRQRVAAIEALPDDGRGCDEGSAVALIWQPERVFASVAENLWTPEARTKQQVDWATLVHRTGRTRALGQAQPLLDAAATAARIAGGLPLVLDMIDNGWLDDLAARLPEPADAYGSTGPARAQLLRTALAGRLTALVQITLADQGRGGWPLSWAMTGGFTLSGHSSADLTAAVAGAVSPTPATWPLRALLSVPPAN